MRTSQAADGGAVIIIYHTVPLITIETRTKYERIKCTDGTGGHRPGICEGVKISAVLHRDFPFAIKMTPNEFYIC